MSALDDILARLRGAMPSLRREYGVRTLAVFGSVARGEDAPASDVDVLVEFEPDALVTLLTLAGLRNELQERLGREVDVVLRRALRPAFRDEVDREAIRVA